MRLLTYNIHGCVGRGGISSPDAVLDVIAQADADIVTLQEVYDNDNQDRSFLQELQRRFDFCEIVYGPTMRKSDSHYGNLLMSRLPLQKVVRIDLSEESREPRGAIQILVESEGRPVEVTTTHLGLAFDERRAQVKRLIDASKASEEPLAGEAGAEETSASDGLIRVLMGDLNEWSRFGRVSRMLRNHFGPAQALRTFPARFPLLALDRIHVRPSQVVSSVRVVDGDLARRASDHRPLVVDLSW
jgi:endonuclease/exonuclease/phosphatase family metal-dependent hydrolase